MTLYRLPLLALSLIASAVSAATVNINSQPTAVTVYTDRAVVTRSGSVALDAGEQTVVFAKLPAQLQEDSLQITAAGSAKATILDISAGRHQQVDSVNPQRLALQQQLDQLQQQQLELADRAAVMQNQRDFIAQAQRALTEPSKEATRPTIEEIKALQVLSESSLSRILAEQRAIEQQGNTLQQQIAVLQASIQVLNDDSGGNYKTVSVRLAVATAGELDLHLDYTTGGATWTPAYDARVEGKQQDITLSAFGVVRQTTGEAWQDVDLTLSTARPALGGSAPLLQPWVLDSAQPIKQKRAMAPAPMQMAAGKVNEVQQEERYHYTKQAAELSYANIESGISSAAFHIPTKSSVAADGTTQKVAITQFALPAQLQYQATPELRETAYLTAQTVNQSAFPLLVGKLNIFQDGKFISSGLLKSRDSETPRSIMPGEAFELALGADEGIAIKRQLLNRLTEQTGLTNGGRRITYQYELTLQNNKAVPVAINFSERVPVSRNEKIVVKLLAPPEQEAKREEAGKLTWNWTLKPQEKRTTQLKFSVEYPADMDVNGL